MNIYDLLARDEQREKDGFPRKIRLGKLSNPGSGETVVVPTTTQDKLYHIPPQDKGEGGTGDGEEGDVIGETPIDGNPQEGEGGDAGDDDGEGNEEEHELQETAKETGKVLTEFFELPNIKTKNTSSGIPVYKYELTDKNRGHGQLLDKKATLKKIVETNIALGRVKRGEAPDTSKLVVGPKDKVYRVLSKEKHYLPKALVFFARDYSGSMSGEPTEAVCRQHLLIYSWLMHQYQGRVENRYVLHDTRVKEVNTFSKYYGYKVAGGTKIHTAFDYINEVVKEESLDKKYNIYVFYGSDGDDFDVHGDKFIPAAKEMVGYVSRLGITIVNRQASMKGSTVFHRYLDESKMLDNYSNEMKLTDLVAGDDDGAIIESIKELVEE